MDAEEAEAAAAFALEYKGSADELEDLREFYLQNEGEVTHILQHIPCARAADTPRLLSILDGQVRQGLLPSFPGYGRTRLPGSIAPPPPHFTELAKQAGANEQALDDLHSRAEALSRAQPEPELPSDQQQQEEGEDGQTDRSRSRASRASRASSSVGSTFGSEDLGSEELAAELAEAEAIVANAAMIMQRHYRGHLAREELLEMKAAATHIQKHHRGRRARARAAARAQRQRGRWTRSDAEPARRNTSPTVSEDGFEYKEVAAHSDGSDSENEPVDEDLNTSIRRMNRSGLLMSGAFNSTAGSDGLGGRIERERASAAVVARHENAIERLTTELAAERRSTAQVTARLEEYVAQSEGRAAEVAAALAATREELVQTQEALRSLREGMGGTVGEDGLAQTASQAQLSQVRVLAPARCRQRLLAPSN